MKAIEGLEGVVLDILREREANGVSEDDRDLLAYMMRTRQQASVQNKCYNQVAKFGV